MAYLSLVAMNQEWIVGFVKHDFENSGDDIDWNHNFWIFMCWNLDSDVVNAILVDKVIEFGIFVILVDQGAVVCQLLRRDYSMLRKIYLQNGLETQRFQMLQIRCVGKAAAVQPWCHFSEILDRSAIIRRWRATVVHGDVAFNFQLV